MLISALLVLVSMKLLVDKKALLSDFTYYIVCYEFHNLSHTIGRREEKRRSGLYIFRPSSATEVALGSYSI